jgi:hypothetical protein
MGSFIPQYVASVGILYAGNEARTVVVGGALIAVQGAQQVQAAPFRQQQLRNCTYNECYTARLCLH